MPMRTVMAAIGVATARRAPGAERWLPHAIVATAFVVVLPALLVTFLIPAGGVAVLLLSIVLGVALSLAAASLGSAIWKRLPGSSDLVFADLMLWGWLRRSVAERRLAQAEKLMDGKVQDLSLDALTNLSELLEARDIRTYGHSQRVTRHAERIASAMGLPSEQVAKVRTAAALHDIGKLHTPRAILNKPGRLTDTEFELVKRHPVDGAAMAAGIGDPEITAMIRHHHERLDGRGYPDGLTGEDIPLGARIIAVADTFDAITSNRTYRRAAHHKRALDVLTAEADRQLDGDAVAAFRGYYRGRRTVAWSAFFLAAPQRVLAWLGGASPAIGAGVTGATALLIGVGNPQAPVSSTVSSPESRAPLPALIQPASAPADAAQHRSPRLARGDARRQGSSGAPGRSRRDGSRGGSRTPSAPGGGAPAAGGGGGGGGGSAPGAGGRPGGTLPNPSKPGPPVGEGDRPPLVKVPEVRVPEVRVPEVRVPEVTVPQVTVPEVPGVPLPEISTPEIRTPEVRLPEVQLPEVQLPEIEVPGLPLP
jgi:putative nucleotidyltransferase with HDIG domain